GSGSDRRGLCEGGPSVPLRQDVEENTKENLMQCEELHTNQAPRCGARTRSGNPCRSRAVRGKRRCRMHWALAEVALQQQRLAERGPTAPGGEASRGAHNRD